MFLVSLTVTKRKKRGCHFHGVWGVLGTDLSTCFILAHKSTWKAGTVRVGALQIRRREHQKPGTKELRSESGQAMGPHTLRPDTL